MSDELQPLLDLPGVAADCDRARDALTGVQRHPRIRRDWSAVAAVSAVRAAHCSALLDDPSAGSPADELAPGQHPRGSARSRSATGAGIAASLAGALRVGQALDGAAVAAVVGVWRRAPLQVLARLHTLAAADLAVDSDALGRPRAQSGIAQRLAILAHTVLHATVPAPLVAAVVHGEVLTLRPFGSADGVVARAGSRLVALASGLDAHGLAVPETFWLQRRGSYEESAQGFASGSPAGIGAWVTLCCQGFEAGAREASRIATEL